LFFGGEGGQNRVLLRTLGGGRAPASFLYKKRGLHGGGLFKQEGGCIGAPKNYGGGGGKHTPPLEKRGCF